MLSTSKFGLKVAQMGVHSPCSRFFSSTPLRPNFNNIPGLFVGPQFIPQEDHANFQRDISELFEQFRIQARNSKPKTAEIPQVSKLHNLPTTESFQSLAIPIPGWQEPLLVEYFAKYGEDGHELAYVRGRKKGNSNLPPFAWHIAQRISQAMAQVNGDLGAKYITAGAEDRTWKLTLNYYTCQKENKQAKQAGFPFHTDIQANGDETFILGFGSPATMEFIRHKEDAGNELKRVRVSVNAGELVGLSGEARNEWLHRVVPEENADCDRVSLVLGCRP